LAQGRNIRLVDHFGLTRNVETNGIMGTEHWHTDGYTSPYPPAVTLMCCWQGSESGTDARPSGPTKFCDGADALKRLKEAHPEMYEKALTLVQVFGGPSAQRRNARGTRTLARQADPTDEYGNEFLPMDDLEDAEGKKRKLTPLVRQHPITGELALHGSTQNFWKFLGMPEDESRELMEWFQDWTTAKQCETHLPTPLAYYSIAQHRRLTPRQSLIQSAECLDAHTHLR
jgi:alpha-ketoglutarate-dependent taurine dioxygenase